MNDDLSCFKAYDIRGKVPHPLSARLAYALGASLACEIKECENKNVVVGHDIRLSAQMLSDALCAGLTENGASVVTLDLCGTEEIYQAAGQHNYALGVMITGSHNPADENGFKLVRKGAIPISSDSGLARIKENVARILETEEIRAYAEPPKALRHISYKDEYAAWLVRTSGICEKKPGVRGTVLASVGNGAAGPLLEKLAPSLPFDLKFLHPEPDGHFPNGVPNPLLPERREETAQAVRDAHAMLGVAFDGDFDRCFFYDANGTFVEGYYIVGLIAQALLAREPGATIIHDPRVYWNTRDIVERMGGKAVFSKTGHAFIKESMRKHNALYGGEMSAHHYFRDFCYCDTGMLPFLLVTKLLLDTGKTLEECVADCMQRYPCSGEINRTVRNPAGLLQELEKRYSGEAVQTFFIDGVNFDFAEWRCNIRKSNTEPLVRVNVESRGNKQLLDDKTQELLAFIDAYADRP
ncbi:MAG: phosphomannomutase [Desulfovibrionaceae bacterium]|nr:phosphomannomutase [Desulfovibrionaceae bacterium]